MRKILYVIKVVKPSLVLLITALLLIIMANMAAAANFTYHLHNETSAISSSNRQLLTYNPNSSASYIEGTAALSSTGEKIIEDFETQTGDPNWIGIIPAGSTWTFDVWMSKSSTAATTAYPRVRVRKNNSSGTLILEVTGTTRITNDTTMRKYTLTGTNTSAVTLTASDRLFVTVAVNCTVRVSGTTQKPRLGIEGTAGAANDSTMTTPIPDTTESYHMHNETSAISSLNRQLLLTNPNSSASYVEGTAALR